PRLDFRPELPSPTLTGPPTMDLQVVLDPSLFDTEAAPADLVFMPGDLDEPPSVLMRTEPDYPFRARQREIEGSVQVKLLVKSDGSVGRFEILHATPEGVFEDAVARAVPGWRFKPGRLDGRPVDSWVITTVRFDLGN
ncbi:MAG: energy transducer TonB, partial [Anaerolineae bacterium]